jgi:hypothetical protein
MLLKNKKGPQQLKQMTNIEETLKHHNKYFEDCLGLISEFISLSCVYAKQEN